MICRHGADWFRELGTPTEPGSALVTITGVVADPGVYEIEWGTRLRALVRAAGGLTAAPRAALLGGYGGTWIGAEHLAELSLSDEALAPPRRLAGRRRDRPARRGRLPGRRDGAGDPLDGRPERPPVRPLPARPPRAGERVRAAHLRQLRRPGHPRRLARLAAMVARPGRLRPPGRGHPARPERARDVPRRIPRPRHPRRLRGVRRPARLPLPAISR